MVTGFLLADGAPAGMPAVKAGFATISEHFDAQGLAGLIDRFLKPTTAIILDARGTIDKSMRQGRGRLHHGVQGVPLGHPEHARHACRAGRWRSVGPWPRRGWMRTTGSSTNA